MWGFFPRTLSSLSFLGSQACKDLSSSPSVVFEIFTSLRLDTLSPTSVREAPHAYLISPWSKAWCTTRHIPPSVNKGYEFKTGLHFFIHQITEIWGASLTDVGLRVSSLKKVKIPKTTLGDEDKSLQAWLSKEDNELSVRGKNPPHILYTFLFINGV